MQYKLRPYQEDILTKVKNTFLTESRCVLASCPSSGKTFTTLRFILDNPHLSFLILPHGTTVIKEQWLKECKKLNVTNVTVQLPQAIYNKTLSTYDYLVIDEAHEYASATMVSTIIEKTKPKKILYLTGTPSNFIRDGITTHVVAAETLVAEGHISDLYFGLFSTKAKLTVDDYNNNLDLTEQADAELVSSAKADINSLIKALVTRLSQTNFIKNSPLLAKSNVKLFGALGKTMIACGSIKQLEVIEQVLKAKGIAVISSHSENDVASENIEMFVKDETLKVLLVVGRGILGFNMVNLVNVVDMTGSHNINRIYQLYARAMRKNDGIKQKYFFKLTSTTDMQFTQFYMNAAINLMRYDFISKYNGKNLNEMEIRVLKPRSTNEKVTTVKASNKSAKPKSNGPREIEVDPMFYGAVKANEMLVNIYNNSAETLNEYATMRIGDVLKQRFSIANNVQWTLEKAKTEALKFKTRLEWQKGSSGYKWAQKNNKLDECCAHMDKKRTFWNLETVKAEALKYETKSEWRVSSYGSYLWACKNNKLKECSEHMTPYYTEWTLERAKEEALKCARRGEWLKAGRGSYQWALKNNKLDECCAHMKQKAKK